MIRFSIITVVLNGAGTIRDCLASVRGQTFKPYEHIIIDGASTDGTLEILNEYSKEGYVKVISEMDRGIYDAMNKGVKLATGKVVGFLNADDIYASDEVLMKVAKVFENDQVDSCYGDLVYVDQKNVQQIKRYWRSGPFNPKKFFWGWMPPHPTFFVRRSLYEKHGLFDLNFGTAADYEMMLRLLVKHHVSVEYLPQVLIKMRVGGVSNVTLKARLKANRMDKKAWEVNELKPYPWTLWMKPFRKVGQWFGRPASK